MLIHFFLIKAYLTWIEVDETIPNKCVAERSFRCTYSVVGWHVVRAFCLQFSLWHITFSSSKCWNVKRSETLSSFTYSLWFLHFFFLEQIVVNALAFAIPSIGNVLLVCMMFWLIFAIIGVQIFRGTFYRCTDDDGVLLPVNEIDNKTACLQMNYTWSNSKIHFDNVYYATIALFQVVSV